MDIHKYEKHLYTELTHLPVCHGPIRPNPQVYDRELKRIPNNPCVMNHEQYSPYRDRAPLSTEEPVGEVWSEWIPLSLQQGVRPAGGVESRV
jgi:hypothetical protein